jgi:hypothetical protein
VKKAIENLAKPEIEMLFQFSGALYDIILIKTRFNQRKSACNLGQ